MMTKSEGFQFGYGLFETLLKKDGIYQSLQAHIDRIIHSMAIINMPTLSEEFIKAALENIDYEGVVKLIIYEDQGQSKLSCQTRPVTYSPADYDRGYSLNYSDFKRHSSNIVYQHKTLNGLLNRFERKSTAYDEVVHFNENDVLTECIYSNLFFVSQGVLYTPCVDSGLLPGIQRQNVLSHVKVLGIPTKIGYYKREHIESAEEVFITNSVMGIMPVKSLGTVQYDLNNNILTRQLKKELNI